MAKNGTEVKVLQLPNCDFCKLLNKEVPAEYDAKTIQGPWANMCQKHWDRYSFHKLGTGYGQRLILENIPEPEGGVVEFEPGTVWLDPETGEFTRS